MKTAQRATVYELREKLKAYALQELDKLPETLEGMEPKDRLNILCKLMPFIMPKIESLHPADFQFLSE